MGKTSTGIIIVLVGIIYYLYSELQLERAHRHQKVKRPLDAQIDEADGTKSILIVGDKGVGKSSVANMIFGENIVKIESTGFDKVSTLSFEQYKFDRFKIFEMNGLSGKQYGTDDMLNSITNLLNIVTHLESSSGLNLIIAVMPMDRITDTFDMNYNLFAKQLTNENVPVILVITHAENEQSQNEKWWKENEASFDRYGYNFKDTVMVCSSKGEDLLPAFADRMVQRYEESRPELIKSVDDHALLVGWKLTKNDKSTWYLYDGMMFLYYNLDFVGNPVHVKLFILKNSQFSLASVLNMGFDLWTFTTNLLMDIV